MDNTMSRLFIKNLPQYVVEGRLKDFFSQKGEITDVKLLRTECGKSRRIAFIGFRTQGEAQAALKYFHNSYMDSSKISCQVALPIGDFNIPAPWSRHSIKKQEKNNNSGLTLLRQKEELNSGDLEFQEFLQVMQPRSQSKVWANDTVGIPLQSRQGGENKASAWVLTRYTSSLPRLMPNQENDSTRTKRSHNLDQDELLKNEWSDSGSENGNDLETTTGDDRTPKAQAEFEDLFENMDSGVNESSNLSQRTNNKNQLVHESSRLFVHNLPFTATEDDLTELFQKFGNLSEVHLVRDKNTKMFRGCAFVLYALPESAIRALEILDKSIFQGRNLHVTPAEQPNSSGKPLTITATQHSKSFKEQKAEHRKSAEASGDTRAWNSFYMRPDTVAEYVARKYGVSKSDILDQEGGNVAVKVALGEAHVISDTMKALVNSGVNIAALEKLSSGKDDAISKSNHVILVKNLPYCISEGDLATIFGKYGSIDKIILPPTKVLALVVFLEPANCKAAFNKLCYKNYKGFPLYLENPSRDVFSSSTKLVNDSKDDGVKRVILEQNQLTKGLYDEDIDPDKVESSTPYVTNLNFKTSEECLIAHVSMNLKEGSIRSAKVVRKMARGKIMSCVYSIYMFFLNSESSLSDISTKLST